jgi:hypothetical protein
MYQKIAAAAGTAVAVVGVGTAALATSGPDPTTSGSGQQQSQGTHHGKHHLKALLRRTLHGQVTTKNKDGYVTHSAVRGAVMALSPTSITVKAVDGFSETFTLTKDTRVRQRTPGQHGAKPGTVSDVKSGDQVVVIGKAPEHATAAPTARVVIDGLRKK